MCDDIDPAQWRCPECRTLHEYRHRAPSKCKRCGEVPDFATTVPDETAILEPWLFDPKNPPLRERA